MKEIDTCLICGSKEFGPFLVCKDYTVSKEDFRIQSCNSCGFKFTSPRPQDSDLGRYYKSEEYVSHSDTKKGLVNRLYHLVRNYTLVKKLQLVMRHAGKQGVILDYGCGTGAFIGLCKKNKWSTFGIEPDEQARKMALQQNEIQAHPDIEGAKSALGSTRLNVMTMWHVLEHVSDVHGLFDFINEYMAAKGTLIIAVPNCSSHDAKFYKEHWAAYDVPRHLWHFTPKDMTALVQSKGFKHLQTLPMVFDSFYVSMLSEKYKKGRISYPSALWRGFVSNLKANKTGLEFSSQIYVFKKN
jgi:2-polyprenyl-3-methyl-5-hydroxy-6-metoxy-1,4-benzoquinol methylase